MRVQNLYPGINPHLNSALQGEGGGWESFHAKHVADLAEHLDAILPVGYYAILEKSMQIGTFDRDTTEPLAPSARTIPDVSVYREYAASGAATSTPPIQSPTLVFPLPITSPDEPEDITAVAIYEIVEGRVPGRPVTRIELLSPANKPGHTHYASYIQKRRETLESGLCLVEIDYLHETRPILDVIPSYKHRQTNASPYYILVSDPRPTFAEGNTAYFAFGLQDALPIFALPLVGQETTSVDLGAVYTHTFVASRFVQAMTHYDQEPERFHLYSSEDQTFIRQRMVEIAQNQKD